MGPIAGPSTLCPEGIRVRVCTPGQERGTSMSSTTRSVAIALTLIMPATTATAQETSGGPISRFFSRIRQHHSTTTASTSTLSAPVAPVATAPDCDCSSATDPYGFASILNRLRSSAGLHPVSYDPELSTWASQNNAVQCRRGIGHHVNPSCFQNCGWNYPDASSVAQGWMDSPGHRQNMLSPSITRFGIAMGPGPYWTLNAR
jgi:uncharacterized protein YkwD